MTDTPARTIETAASERLQVRVYLVKETDEGAPTVVVLPPEGAQVLAESVVEFVLPLGTLKALTGEA